MITTTTTVATTPPSVRVALFGDAPDVAAALARRLNEQDLRDALGGEVRALSPAGQTAVVAEAARAADSLFSELDLLGILVAGWRTHRELTAAARATAAAHGTSQVIRVYDHLVTSTHTPYVEVFAGPKRIARIDFPIHLNFRIHALEATVRGGRLVALHTGTCELEASLAAKLATQELPLIARTVTVRLPLQVPLGAGIPLAEAGTTTTSASHTTETRRAHRSR